MTNKNPYEIRLDVLKLAKEMLELDYKAKETSYLTTVGSLQTSNLAAVADVAAPNAPTVDDIISKASTLYDFVSNTGSSSIRSSGSKPEYLAEARHSRNK